MYVHFNGQTFSSMIELVSFTSKLLGLKNAKNYFFKEKLPLRVVFITLTSRWLQTGLSDLKITKHLKFFYAFLKMLHNSKKIEIFEIHQ